MNLSELQEKQPWKVAYIDPKPRPMVHDILHLIKSLGMLAAIPEKQDHGDEGKLTDVEFRDRVSDLVVCALHIASNPPIGYDAFDLEEAVIYRMESVNGISLNA